jgi:ATP-binding cassette, subfamily C, bacteriocin exporter
MQVPIQKLQKIHVQQQGQSDCGVACLLSIIKYYNGNETIENLRRLSDTTLLGLHHAAQQFGFDAEGCEADIQALINHNEPCILHIIIEGNLRHYVVCYGTVIQQSELKFIIGDPGKGIAYLDQTELEKIWQSKTCLTLSPNENFKTSTDINNGKRKWILELIKQDFPLLSIAAVLGVAIAALGLAMAIFSQRLIDDILPKRNFTKLNLGIALVFALLVIKEGLSFLRQLFLLRQSKDFNIRIIDFFYNHLLQLPKPFFDIRKIGEFTARLNDTARIQRVISQLAGNVIIDILVTLITIMFLFTYSWKVAIICLLALPVYFFLIYNHNKNIIARQRNVMSSYALTEANYISTLQGIEPIKNYNKQNLFAAHNETIYGNFQQKIFLLGKIQIRLSFLANSFGVIFLIAILLFASKQVLNNQLKTGELIAILGMCGSLLPNVANLALISIPINEAKIAFDRMFEFTSIKPETKSNDKGLDKFNFLQVQNLAFRFAGRSRVLKNISFDVGKGEIIAIMGENGCGKSTISQILQKHYNAESGNIAVNSFNQINEISFSDWRNIIGLVPQNIHIFNCTVLENIAFEDAFEKQNEVLDFIIQYGFSKFIDTLPQSFMTLVGEEGINLSGGQKQIIALARALYHKPQLLLLDEATSAMDRQSEKFVLDLLMKLKKNMAIIFITHRLHVLKNFCDRIYIIENGATSTFGNHESLLLSENLYSTYWNDLVS